MELAVERQVLVAPERPSQDLDVLTGAGQRAVGRLAVPAFDDLGAGDAKAQDEPAVGQVVQGDGVHGRSRRGAGRHLDDAGAQSDPFGVGGQPDERREGVRAPRLGGPRRVVAELFGLLDEVDEIGGRLRSPVAEAEA